VSPRTATAEHTSIAHWRANSTVLIRQPPFGISPAWQVDEVRPPHDRRLLWTKLQMMRWPLATA
jgi:hypothetical protein